MKRAETAIQKALVAWIGENYLQVRIHATLNETNYMNMDMGSEKGIPDLLLFWHVDDVEHIWYLELKTKDGKLRKSQKEWASRFKKASNNHYAVAYGFSHAKELICNVLLNKKQPINVA